MENRIIPQTRRRRAMSGLLRDRLMEIRAGFDRAGWILRVDCGGLKILVWP